MADTWPASLPQRVLVEGYAEAMGDGRIRSQTDVGPAKVRRRSSTMPGPLQGVMRMTREQLVTLRKFVDVTLMGGSLPFFFPDPLTEYPALVRFADRLPSRSARSGMLFDVALDLEVFYVTGPLTIIEDGNLLMGALSRLSVATYWDANGALQTAANNEARLDHDPVTHEPLGVLIEGAATNLVLGSNDPLNAGAWSDNLTSKDDAGSSRGLKFVKATRVDWPDASQRQNATIQQRFVDLPVGTYTASAIVRKGNQASARLAFAGNNDIFVNLYTGTITSTNGLAQNAVMKSLGSGLWRVSFSVTTTAISTLYLQMFAGYSTNVAGDWTEWAAPQLEVGEAPSSYIPTADVTATRASETLSLATSAFPAKTILVEYKTGLTRLGQVPWCLDDGASVASRIAYFDDGSISPTANAAVAQIVNNNAVQALVNLTDTGGTSRDVIHRVATAWSDTWLGASLDGADAVEGSSTGLPPLSRLLIGRHAGGAYLNGHIRQLIASPRTMSAAELKAWSAPP